jgi:hypothetical protein
MGLLDDAIREHLELKRRRGADPAEIERDEQEALGPVRRTPEEEAQPGLEASTAPEGGEHGGELAEPWDDPFADESEALAEEPGLFDAEQEPFADEGSPFEDDDPFRDEPPARSSAVPTEPDAATQIFDQEPEEEPPPPRSATPPPSRGHLGEETAEFDVPNVDEPEDAGDAEAQSTDQGHEPAPADRGGEKKADEDVLEETPEFLQDAPDHDRLWFEQRPPRDFDFDG